MELACLDRASCHRDIDPADAVKLVRESKDAVWVHVYAGDRIAATRLLEDDFGFHELAVEDALSPDERPALTDFDDYLFLVAPAVQFTEGEEEYVEIAFFLKEKSLVTVAEKRSHVTNVWLDRWSKHKMREGTTPADLLHVLVDAIVDDYVVAIDRIEDVVDEVGDSIIAGEKGKVVELLQTKRRLLEMRRRITPLRDVINSLLRRDLDLIPEDTRRYFQDVYDHASRITESIDLQRDTLTSLLDVHLSIVSNSLNEVMKMMTVIATVLMTAALIAGIYGMNFERMPELHWAWGYPFALFLMVASSAFVLLLFKWKKWL